MVEFVASIAVCLLSFFEHGRSVKPSSLLSLYLLVSVPCDAIGLWSLYQSHGHSPRISLLATALAVKFLLLVLESSTKRRYLREPYRDLPLEQTIGVINRAFLFWVNAEIMKGNSKMLSVPDLPDLDEPLKSKELRARMELAWEKTCKLLTS